MNQTKAESIYLQLKKDILNFKYGVGDIINEQTLAHEYNVSKTPVREALTALVQDGCLIKYPRRGYFIKEINFKEYYELMQYRFLIESGIAQYIISNCSDGKIESLFQYTPKISATFEEFEEENKKFHLAMAKVTGNRYMISALENVFEINVRESAITGYNRLKDDIHMDHRCIVEALKEKDYEKAKSLVMQDLKRSDEKTNIL